MPGRPINTCSARSPTSVGVNSLTRGSIHSDTQACARGLISSCHHQVDPCGQPPSSANQSARATGSIFADISGPGRQRHLPPTYRRNLLCAVLSAHTSPRPLRLLTNRLLDVVRTQPCPWPTRHPWSSPSSSDRFFSCVQRRSESRGCHGQQGGLQPNQPISTRAILKIKSNLDLHSHHKTQALPSTEPPSP
jgi:hypothetical protein